MEYQTKNLMKENENRGTNKAYLCEEAVSTWNYMLVEQQKSPSAIDFIEGEIDGVKAKVHQLNGC